MHAALDRPQMLTWLWRLWTVVAKKSAGATRYAGGPAQHPSQTLAFVNQPVEAQMASLGGVN
jgi:hypothetical protein